MDQYRHHVSGFFAHREEAENALSRLAEGGLPRERMQLLDSTSMPPAPAPHSDSNEVLTNVLVDGGIGTAVGTGVGALATVGLVAAEVSLFIASPLLAPLVMLGWGASAGAIVGAAAGAQTDIKRKDGWLSDLVRDAIASGQVVLVVQTLTAQETAAAREVIEAAVGEVEEVSTV
ncbi:MAG: hypothetical protein Q8M20_04155 [Rhodocyclaceae bacterium]|nr:hypothetical protein [Rhodocyclaceae bacterium]MDZ4213952.1 hypothetical protein [Rhodocyclaceae bacterium]